jgi:hypothetical protein
MTHSPIQNTIIPHGKYGTPAQPQNPAFTIIQLST